MLYRSGQQPVFLGTFFIHLAKHLWFRYHIIVV
jgi:hypothetical protein